MKKLIFLMLIFILAGCNKASPSTDKNISFDKETSKNSEIANEEKSDGLGEEPEFDDNRKFDINYDKFKEYSIKGISPKYIGDIEVYDENIVLTDTKDNRLLKADIDGNVLNEVGSTGQADSEFNNPQRIFVKDEKIYVLDKGNRRIQTFDGDLKFLDKFDLNIPELKYLEIESFILDAEKNIYIITHPENHELNCMWCIAKDGKIIRANKIIEGFLIEKDDKIFAVESLIVKLKKSGEEIKAITRTAGSTNMYEVKKTKDKLTMEKFARFPYMYTPVDIVWTDKFYFASDLWNLFEELSLKDEKFKLQKTLTPQFKHIENDGFRFVKISDNFIFLNKSADEMYISREL